MLVGPLTPLARRPQKVLVAGPSGVGKTTAAGRIAAVLRIEHVEIDGLFHGEDWTPRPSFEDDVRAFSERATWVTEWQYGIVRSLLAERADLLVWMDLPRRTVMRQVVVRTVIRRLRRQELWNGNVEPPLHTVATDPEHILRWAWSTYRTYPPRMAALLRDAPHLVIVHVTSHRQLDTWLAGPLTRSRDADGPLAR